MPRTTPISKKITELKNIEQITRSFAPIIYSNTKILVLGSLPGKKSLELREYYGHPRNRIWKIISHIKECKIPNSYEEKKKVLESIIHPLVRDLMAKKITASNSPYSIIMVPLIFETNSMSNYNRILVIDCDPRLQLERAILRDNNSKEQIQKIIDSQCTREERISIANDIIPNNDSIKNLKTRTIAMHKFYLGLL